ncbi:START domain-containing protein [Spirochaetota bacterium]
MDIDSDYLIDLAVKALGDSEKWKPNYNKEGIMVSSGYLHFSPIKAYRSEVELEGSVEDVATFIADEMVERLPDWNREFENGHVIEKLEDGGKQIAWLVRVRYKTPPPLKNREYLYYLVRRNLSDGSVVIVYNSVVDERYPESEGYVRAALYPTVHLCVPLGEKRTFLKHILANDLCGRFSPWLQNNLLSGSLVSANVRDSKNQRVIFKSDK